MTVHGVCGASMPGSGGGEILVTPAPSPPPAEPETPPPVSQVGKKVVVNWSARMAFTVETGEGVTGANSYIALADAKTYVRETYGCDDDLLSYPDARIEGALRAAARWLDGAYRHLYRGARSSDTQGLEWPRTGDDLETHFPAADLGEAQTEVARRILGGEIPINRDYDPSAGARRIKREKIDVIEREYETAGAPATASTTPHLPQVERIIGRWITGSRAPGAARFVPWVRG